MTRIASLTEMFLVNKCNISLQINFEFYFKTKEFTRTSVTVHHREVDPRVNLPIRLTDRVPLLSSRRNPRVPCRSSADSRVFLDRP